MKSTYYPNSVNKLREAILKNFPEAAPREDFSDMSGYVLWMLQAIKKMDDPYKAGRWIGYAFRATEELGVIDNSDSRDMARRDVRSGHDKQKGVAE